MADYESEFITPTLSLTDKEEEQTVYEAVRYITDGRYGFDYLYRLPPSLRTPHMGDPYNLRYMEWLAERDKNQREAVMRLKDMRVSKELAAQHGISPWWLIYEKGISEQPQPIDKDWIEALRVAMEVVKGDWREYDPAPNQMGRCRGIRPLERRGTSRKDIVEVWNASGKESGEKFRWLLNNMSVMTSDSYNDAWGTPQLGWLKDLAHGMAISKSCYRDGPTSYFNEQTLIAIGLMDLADAEVAISMSLMDLADVEVAISMSLMVLPDVDLPRLSSTEPSGGAELAAGINWSKPASQEYRHRLSVEFKQWGSIVGEENAMEARSLARYEGGHRIFQLPAKGASRRGFKIVVDSMSHWQRQNQRGWLHDAVKISALFKGYETLIPNYVKGIERLHDGTHIPERTECQFYGDWLKCLTSAHLRAITPTAGWSEFEKTYGKPTRESLLSAQAEIHDASAEFEEVMKRIFGASIPAEYVALRAHGAKTHEEIPAPGGSLGLKVGKFVVRQLAHDDMTAPAIGVLTNCCQHLRGFASGAAEQTYTDATSAVWVVEEKGKIVAQAWVWRTTTNGIHLDSVEALGGRGRFTEAFKAAAEAAVGRLGVTVVTAAGNQWSGKKVTIVPKVPLGYSGDFDGEGYVLAGDVEGGVDTYEIFRKVIDSCEPPR
jgi:hypothetical protein